MRVIAGKARSMPLKCPEGRDVRPTTDRIKETLFNILQNDIPGAAVADIFAGSGGIGIEALSRGARKAYFIENAREAYSCIEDNLSFTKLKESAIVLKKDVFSALYDIYEKELDIVFMDPPYGKGLEKQVLCAFADRKYITEDTLIVIESDLNTDFTYLPELGYELMREKRYKTNRHLFVRKKRQE